MDPITRRFHRMTESTAAIVASVVDTTRRPGSSSSVTLDHLDHNQTIYTKHVLLVL